MSLAAGGDHLAAADLMRQALELVPGWAAGWSLLGDWLREAGDAPGALAAYGELARLDHAGIFGAALKLAALGAAPLPRGTDLSYVEALFDDYAPRFEAELLGRLDYRVPAGLCALVDAELRLRAVGSLATALDLGCGTGLMGERLRRHVSFLEGVDLSAEMLSVAAGKGIYDRLERAEISAWLPGRTTGFDLVTAADVLNYCGALPPIVAAVAAVLVPGGLFGFSVELNDGSEPLALGPTLRYRHGREATLAACRDAGLEVLQSQPAELRRDRGLPVAGLLVLAARPGAAPPLAAPAPFAEPAPVSAPRPN